jgi:hypothetical protein
MADGRADNVKGASKDDSADISLHDLGTGENTQVALNQLEINRAMREKDLGVDARFLIMPNPDRPTVGGTTPNIPKDQSITS